MYLDAKLIVDKHLAENELVEFVKFTPFQKVKFTFPRGSIELSTRNMPLRNASKIRVDLLRGD